MKTEKQAKIKEKLVLKAKGDSDLPEEQPDSTTQAEEACAEATSYGKFKTLSGLIGAYRALQSQFTKRSQRLSELEKENFALKEQLHAMQKDNCGFFKETPSEGEPLPKEASLKSERLCEDISAEDETGNARDIRAAEACELENASVYEKGGAPSNRPDYVAETERFLRANPFAAAYACEIADAAAKNGDLSSGFLERAFISVLGEKLRLAKKEASDADKIFESAIARREVYERIIKRYLSEIEKNRGATLICSEGVAACAPPIKPKNLEEAGAFAASMLRIK